MLVYVLFLPWTVESFSVGCMNCFLLTVPIEEVTRWQYIKTVLIIYPVNLQTITISLDVVKWR